MLQSTVLNNFDGVILFFVEYFIMHNILKTEFTVEKNKNYSWIFLFFFQMLEVDYKDFYIKYKVDNPRSGNLLLKSVDTFSAKGLILCHTHTVPRAHMSAIHIKIYLWIRWYNTNC